ncbi:MAG: CAP domain-containing protein [Lachnospiraceae bacterium]|nr:CAP domain-containing protein [Lachnospiraceae bacterium]
MDPKRIRLFALIIAAAMLTIAVGVTGCGRSKTEFSPNRACRDASERSEDIMLDGPEFPDPGGTEDPTLREEAMNVFMKLNDERMKQGLPALAWDADLEAAAAKRAEELSVKFDHVRPDGSEWFTADPLHVIGENICRGPKKAEEVFPAWLAGQNDAGNFLSADFTRTAFSVFAEQDGNYYWAAEFGAD